MKNSITSFLRFLQIMEDLLLGGLLIGMVLLATYQILLRNILDSGLIWGDEILRIMVLWIGLVGATVASRNRRQINIDILSKILPPHWQWWKDKATSLFTAVICLLLTWHTARFVHDEFTFGATAVAGIRSGWFELVIPVCFALIGLRYLVHVFDNRCGDASAEEGI